MPTRSILFEFFNLIPKGFAFSWFLKKSSILISGRVGERLSHMLSEAGSRKLGWAGGIKVPSRGITV